MSASATTRGALTACIALGAAVLTATPRYATSQDSSSVRVIDAFDSVGAWSAHPSDGVSLKIARAPGRRGSAMRLDVNFGGRGGKGGAGYAIARRPVSLDLPADYELSFWVRANIPPNDLEFKLIDSTGDNVWWSVRREFAFPRTWQKVVIRKRHVSFAWGPIGGGEPTRIASLEIVVTAGSGGRGSVWIDDLTFEPREPQPATWPRPVATATSGDASAAVDGDSTTAWRSARGRDTLTLSFGRRRELGGLLLHWLPGAHASRYAIDARDADSTWRTVYRVERGNGGRDPVPLPELDATALRIRLLSAATDSGQALREVAVQPLAWTATANDFATAIASTARRGLYPRYLLGEQQYWTIVGISGDRSRPLLGEDGSLEPFSGGFSIEPFLYEASRLLTWSSARTTHALMDGDLPIPSVMRDHGGTLGLLVTAFVSGDTSSAVAWARYRVINGALGKRDVTLYLAARPFQVNPPWQFLAVRGGTAPIDSIQVDRSGMRIDGRRVLAVRTTPSAWGATSFDEGDIVDFLQAGRLPARARAKDPGARASGALAYELSLEPGESRDVWIAIPLDRPTMRVSGGGPHPGEQALARTRAQWRRELDRVRIDVSDTLLGAEMAETFRTATAHILINRDGAAYRPGARSYARSWIRDGALMSAALLRLGYTKEIRDYIEWYAPYQFPNGKVPCCVDRRGADPVPEHDSHGQLVWLIAEYFRFTGDTALVRKTWPNVAGAVSYIDTLRKERLTPEYATGERRMFRGILPPSISHEGYSAKPMHSHWDNFFALRGLKDAAMLAGVLGKGDDQRRIATLADSMRAGILESIRLSMAHHKIDFIPGSADLGDWDATSTTIAVAPGGELGTLPRAALERTFRRYMEHLTARQEQQKGAEYTPYEWRTVGTLIRLGWKADALRTAEALMNDRRPREWNQWGEVVWRDVRAPKFIGDMPHTWVGADFLRSALDLLAYDDEERNAVIVGAGVPDSWVLAGDGVQITGMRTWGGPLDIAIAGTPQSATVRLGGTMRVPSGGVIVRSPLAKTPASVTVNDEPATMTNGEVVVRALPARVTFRY